MNSRTARFARLGAAATLTVALGCGGAPPRSPDVVLITLDTTRADHLGVYGYARDTSPMIDAFAADAIVYRLAWTTAPWTLPSHASMLTGKHPTSHGAHSNAGGGDASISEVLPFVPENNFRANRLGEEERTLAELLSERGYATGAFAAGHWLAPAFGLLQGYAFRDVHVSQLEGRPGSEITENALAWLRDVPAEQPLHLLVNYFDPHHPYDSATERLPALPEPATNPAMQAEIDAYDAEIRLMDRHVGALLRGLAEIGRYDDALIIVVSDHGELFGEHGQTRHGPYLYEELLRVALLVRLPGGRGAGSSVEAPVSVVDLLPLIAAEVGFVLPPGVEGVMPGERSLVLAESRPNGFDLRKHGAAVDRELTVAIEWPWKLISGSRGERELYHLERDAAEARNLAGDPREARLFERLERARAAFRAPSAPAAPTDVAPQTEENLRRLGYIE